MAKLKLSIKNYEIIIVAVLFLTSFWLWTLPLQSSNVPFGEGDAAWQFAAADQMYMQNHASFRIPSYLGNWYYGFNTILGPNAIEYPPPYPVNIALSQIFGGDRFVSAYIMFALLDMLASISLFLLIRKLYGILPGFLAGFAMVFSMRDIMLYLLGQRGSVISFTFIPIALYSFYMYLTTSDSDKKKNVYLFTTILVVASQYLFHVQGVMISIGVIILFSLFMWLKNKKFPLSISSLKSNWKIYSISVLLLLVFTLPFLLIYFGAQVTNPVHINNVSRLFSWYKISDQPDYSSGNITGYPIIYFSFSQIYNYWYFPFLIIGIILLLIRREPKDLLILSWLLGVYILIHLDVTGYFSVQRSARMLLAETALFYSLIAIGIAGLPSLLSNFYKIKESSIKTIKYLLAAIFIIFLVFANGKAAYSTLNGAYSPILRLNPYQMQVSDWMASNLPENAVIIAKGTITYPKVRFMLAISQRYVTNQVQNLLDSGVITQNDIYYMVDYSDLVLLGQQDAINSQLEWEKLNFQNSTLIYNQNNIHIWHGNITVFTNGQ